MFGAQGAKKPAAPLKFPDFNTDVLQDTLRPLDEMASRAQGAEIESRLHTDLMNKEQPLIPLPIRHLTLKLLSKSVQLSLASDAPSDTKAFFSQTPSVCITMLVRMLQDLSETFHNRTQPITCTYITDGNLTPLILLLDVMVNRLKFQHIIAQIIDLGSSDLGSSDQGSHDPGSSGLRSPQASCHISLPRANSTNDKQAQKKATPASAPRTIKKKLRWLQRHIHSDKIAVEYFCSTGEYLTWSKNNQHKTSLLFMTGFEPLGSCVHLLPAPQQAQQAPREIASIISTHKKTARGNMIVLTEAPDVSPALTAVIIYPQIADAPFQIYITTEHVTHPLAGQLQNILASCTSLQNCTRTLSRNKHTSHLNMTTCTEPHLSFEEIAQQNLKDNGIAYHTLTTPFGVYYLKRYNKQREKKRIMSGTSVPSYRHYFKDRNLSKVWPHEKEPLLTKAPSKKRSLKK